MDIFRVVSFVHNVEIGMSESVTLFQEFFGMRNVMDRMLRDLETSFETGYDLSIGIDRERCFLELFSCLTSSQGIVVASIWAGETEWIYGGTVDLLTPVLERFHEPVECRGSDSLAEYMDSREMRYFIEMDLLTERDHDLGKFCCVPVIFWQVLFQEK